MAVYPAERRGRSGRHAWRKGLALIALLTQVCLSAHLFHHAIDRAAHHDEIGCAQCAVPAGGAPLPQVATLVPPPRRVAFVLARAAEARPLGQPAPMALEPRGPPA